MFILLILFSLFWSSTQQRDVQYFAAGIRNPRCAVRARCAPSARPHHNSFSKEGVGENRGEGWDRFFFRAIAAAWGAVGEAAAGQLWQLLALPETAAATIRRTKRTATIMR